MRRQRNRRAVRSVMLAALLPGFLLAACDNQINFSPTAPTFTDLDPVSGLRTLRISGALAAEQGSCTRATILFNGQEVGGARTRCDQVEGCTEVQLEGTISSPTGRHTITFQVLRQSALLQEYLATGRVEISRSGLHLPTPAILELRPSRALLHEGEGITFEIELSD